MNNELDNTVKVGDYIRLIKEFDYYYNHINTKVTKGTYLVTSVDLYYKYIEITVQNNTSIRFHPGSINGKKFRKYFRNKNLENLLKNEKN